jgi:hypothetical protein
MPRPATIAAVTRALSETTADAEARRYCSLADDYDKLADRGLARSDGDGSSSS